jgi:hypothetical protein
MLQAAATRRRGDTGSVAAGVRRGGSLGAAARTASGTQLTAAGAPGTAGLVSLG